MSVHVTEHAIDRYIERVAPVDRDRARSVMQSAEPVIELAVRFGGHVVHLGSGGKLILRGSDRISVVTVIGNRAIAERDKLQLTSPALCGLCGLRCSHPIAGACTRAECPLGAERRTATTNGRNSS